MVRLVRRTEYGRDREMLALALGRMDRKRAVPVLLELLDDDVMAGHAASALARLAPPEAREKLEALKSHPRELARRNAAKAIAAIDKAEAKVAPKSPSKSASKSPSRTAAKTEPAAADELEETSTGFDLEQVEPFLERLSSLVTGFGAKQIAQVMETLDDMDIDDELSLEFDVKFRGLTVPLHIGLFMDDVDAPDIYFSTTPDLAARIAKLIESL